MREEVNVNNRQKKVKKIVEHLKEYINTYDNQTGYLNYSDEVIIDDLIYGLGIALDEKYKFANGFDKFKERLKEHLSV
jgi:DNA-binding MltR family transcriptional regulator